VVLSLKGDTKMIPSYDLMYVITKECISYLQSVWGNDECEDCTFEDIYCCLMIAVNDGLLDIPLYIKESKEYYKTKREVNFNKYMLDVLLKMYEENKMKYTYKVDNVTHISDEFYVLEKELEKLVKEN
jgi:hypothetical protein